MFRSCIVILIGGVSLDVEPRLVRFGHVNIGVVQGEFKNIFLRHCPGRKIITSGCGIRES